MQAASHDACGAVVHNQFMAKTLSGALRVGPGPVRLSDYPPDATPRFKGGKKNGRAALAALAGPVGDLQERLYAESRGGGKRSLLLVVQGMDTSGKGGVMRHCVGQLDPQGVNSTAFKAPSRAELRHDFLWRIERHVPEPGMIAIFDRSHYEDVLIAKVHEIASADTIASRYPAINSFEKELTKAGTTIIKCFLHISKKEQGERLAARLDDPAKHWKFNPDDVDERSRWEDYQRAYEAALQKCSTTAAPWYVIPSDHKWYKDWAITTLLLEHLSALDPQWPKGDFDVEEQKTRLVAS